MATKKKTGPVLPNSLQTRKNHPIWMILDFHEKDVKEFLKTKGTAVSEKIKILLPAIERVRRHISSEDAASAAVFMYELALKLERAGLSLRGKKRMGFKKDRRWLDEAIREAIQQRPGFSRKRLWNYFEVNHKGPDNALEIEANGVYGSVHFENESLIFDDNDDNDSINFETFRKAVTELRK